MQADRRISVRGVILHDGKLLAVRLQANGHVSGSRPFWCLPGGGLEANEGLLDCLERELIEETGVKPRIGRLLYVQQFKDDKREFLDFFFAVLNPEDYESINLADTSHGNEEIAELAYIAPSTPDLLPEFLQSTDVTADMSNDKAQYFNYL